MALRATIEEIRKNERPLLTIARYQYLTNRCLASAYADFRTHPELAVKSGRRTLVIRDAMLALMAGLKPWVPESQRVNEKDRVCERSLRPWHRAPRKQPSDIVTPRADAPIAKPRRRPPQRVSAAPAPQPGCAAKHHVSLKRASARSASPVERHESAAAPPRQQAAPARGEPAERTPLANAGGGVTS
jgi:hypothetical protein